MEQSGRSLTKETMDFKECKDFYVIWQFCPKRGTQQNIPTQNHTSSQARTRQEKLNAHEVTNTSLVTCTHMAALFLVAMTKASQELILVCSLRGYGPLWQGSHGVWKLRQLTAPHP